jgi:hypothetical protein
MRRAPQAVVADFGAGAWEDVLQESLKKVHAGECDSAYLLGSVVTVPKRHVVVGHLIQSTIGDRDAEDIAPEIVEHALPPTRGLCMDDLRRRPRRGCDLIEEPRMLQSSADLCAEDDRQAHLGHFGGYEGCRSSKVLRFLLSRAVPRPKCSVRITRNKLEIRLN